MQCKSLSHVSLFATPWTIYVHGILRARILEWVAFPFSKGSSQSRDLTHISHIAGYLPAEPQSSCKILKVPSEREIKESISFTIATKRIKYLGINLFKETKYLYSENYKILMKEMKDDINRWRDIPCSLVGLINIVK